MFAYHLYLDRINPKDYPEFITTEHDLQRPGVILAEHHALTGIRVGVPLGCMLCVGYFYLYHLPRIPMKSRCLVRLGDYLCPTLAYSTPLGLTGGLLYGAVHESARLRDDVLTSTLQDQCRAAEKALRHYENRRSRAIARIRACMPWYAKLWVLHLAQDPTEIQLRRMGLPRKSYKDFIEKNSLLWTSLHYSKVHDTQWYRHTSYASTNYRVPAIPAPSYCDFQNEKDLISLGHGLTTMVKSGCQDQEHTLGTSMRTPRSDPYFSKLQVDALVTRVMQLRASSDEARWLRSAGRLSLYGMLATLALSKGSLPYRTSKGLGLGVVFASVLSATRLDDMATHLP